MVVLTLDGCYTRRRVSKSIGYPCTNKTGSGISLSEVCFGDQKRLRVTR